MPDYEYIERKGIGHPDSIADLVAEEVIRRYNLYFLEQYGHIPNGWFDKVVVSGGEAHLDFGEATIIKKPTIYLFGKAISTNGSIDYVKNILEESAHAVLGQVFNNDMVANVELAVDVNSGVGAEHDRTFYDVTEPKDFDGQWDRLKSNDTVVCVGWAPLSKHEKYTIEVENYINGPAFKAQFPETGSDVKVLTVRRQDATEVTFCIPFIAARTPSYDYYAVRKAAIAAVLREYATSYLASSHVTIHLNTKDVPGKGYLTVYGSAFDKGDIGVTGRGNKFPGLISVLRPSGVEAFCGKNSLNHTGKLFSLLASSIANDVHLETQAPVQVVITANNGDSLGSPRNLDIFIDGVLAKPGSFTTICEKRLADISRYATASLRASVIENFKTCHGFAA